MPRTSRPARRRTEAHHRIQRCKPGDHRERRHPRRGPVVRLRHARRCLVVERTAPVGPSRPRNRHPRRLPLRPSSRRSSSRHRDSRSRRSSLRPSSRRWNSHGNRLANRLRGLQGLPEVRVRSRSLHRRGLRSSRTLTALQAPRRRRLRPRLRCRSRSSTTLRQAWMPSPFARNAERSRIRPSLHSAPPPVVDPRGCERRV